MPRTDDPLGVECTAAKAAGAAAPDQQFLDTLTRAATTMSGDDQAAAFTFALACEMAGKEPPDFGCFAERE